MEDNNQDELIMQFDPNTIEHLGIQMYSTLPPVIAEIVSNAYDADAETVKIFLYDENDKIIKVIDNGHGMCYSELNSKFLLIGRNRRKDEGTQITPLKKRKVIGKKGIGKLAIFGVATVIEVETIKDNLRNSFKMDWNKLEEFRTKHEPYKPEVIIKDENVNLNNGTIFCLTEIKRKTLFNPESLAYSLAKYFTIFDEEDFTVEIIHNDDLDNKITIKNNFKYKNISEVCSWDFPIKNHPHEYEYSDQIRGKIISSKEVITSSLNGIALFSRGKLVNEHSFYDINTSSQGYSYITGWLNIDFIDDWDKEVIATNRKSLHWEDNDTVKLRDYLTEVIRAFYNEATKKRAENKVKEIERLTGINIPNWLSSLQKHERKLAQKMVDSIKNSDGLEPEKAGDLILYVRDNFQFESFKEMAEDLVSEENLDILNILNLFTEWEIIEAREFYKISLVRINAIKTFEKYIMENAREVPTIHNFLKTFPWLLDPRIMEFQDEVYFSRILKENFDDSEEPLESDRRIDFLCTSIANNRFVIELKRPQHKIKKNDFEQAKQYRTFVETHSGNEPSINKLVVAIVICGDISTNDNSFRDEIVTYGQAGKVYVKTYADLLEQARKYHQEFINKYEDIEKRQSHN